MTRRLLSAGILLSLSISLLSVIGCTPADRSDGWAGNPGTKVLASFAPIQCFAMNIAGEDANVRVLFGEQGPHHIKDSPGHVKMFAGADVLFINGLGLEDRNVRTIAKGTAKKIPVVSLGATLPESLLIEGGCSCCKDDDNKGGEHDHTHADFDPHVWLGIEQSIRMVEAIRDDLKKRDPAKAAAFDGRADRFIAKLNKLKADGTAMFQGKTEKQFISFHESLNYFSKNFGLKIPEVIQTTPGQEPTNKELKSLLERCEKNQIRVIAIEPQYGAGSSAKAVADALKAKGLTDVQLVVVDPLETAIESEMNADWYETKMRANLEALAKALK
jgi:zinc transport system substrate-binding protein